MDFLLQLMREEGCSDQIQHGGEFSWRVALKQKLTIHWSLWTELKGKFRTPGCVFLSEANRLPESSHVAENGSVAGECGASATGATWKHFIPDPLQNTCGSALDANVASVQVILTCPPSAVARYSSLTWSVNDFYQLPKPSVGEPHSSEGTFPSLWHEWLLKLDAVPQGISVPSTVPPLPLLSILNTCQSIPCSYELYWAPTSIMMVTQCWY